MKKLILLIGIIIVTATYAEAQQYNTAVGVRFDSDNFGFTIQQRIMARTTLEGMLLSNAGERQGVVLYQQHFPIGFRAFNYYAGFGGHYGVFRNEVGGNFYGVNGILGIELKTPFLPLLISGDIMPQYRMNTNDFNVNAGLSLRFVLFGN